jgi:hypothetical protein
MAEMSPGKMAAPISRRRTSCSRRHNRADGRVDGGLGDGLRREMADKLDQGSGLLTPSVGRRMTAPSILSRPYIGDGPIRRVLSARGGSE